VSRDGRKVAVVLSDERGKYETWVADLDRPGLRRVLTLPNADCANPVWSPSGDQLAYDRTARDKDDGTYLRRTDGVGSAQLLLRKESQEVGLDGLSWAPDGSGLIIKKTVGGKGDMLLVPVSPTGEASKPRPLRATPANEGDARFSPDGRFIAFASDESGKGEVYVASYGADGALGPAQMMSNGGGAQPVWAADGRRLFYYNEPDKVMSVTLSLTPRLSASAPVVAYDLKKLRVNATEWDIMPDGRLLAIQKGAGEDDITVFNVVLNWFDELRAKAPMKK
jgi:Tol biopolymer transport system component